MCTGTLHASSTTFCAIMRALPLCRSIPGVEGEDRFGGKNVSVHTYERVRVRVRVCVRVCVFVCTGVRILVFRVSSRMHYTVWNFGYKCLKGLITRVPISATIILTSYRAS